MFARESLRRATTHVSHHKLSDLPKQFKHVDAVAQGKREKGKKKSLLTTKHRSKQFLNNFYESDDTLYCKFCQRNIDRNRVYTCRDHLSSKAHVINKENTALPTLSNNNFSVKGKQTEFRYDKMEKRILGKKFIGP